MASPRANLARQLRRYEPFDLNERRNVVMAIPFIKFVPQAFNRTHLYGGHVTAGYMVANPSRTRVLLNRHAISGQWMNFGGHADGDMDIANVAKKELEEEAGITQFTGNGNLFDVDIHTVAPHTRKGRRIPWHVHYDFNFLALVEDNAIFAMSEESLDVAWFSMEDAKKLMQTDNAPKDEQMQRMLSKIESGWSL